MAVREIEEHEYLSGRAVVQTVNQMLSHPEARKLLLEARKKADPNAIIPEYDSAASVKSDMDQMREMLAADKAERARERQQADEDRRVAEFSTGWEKQKSKLRSRGFADEGLEAVEAFAQENGIANLEIAADAWEKRNPPADPVQPNGYGRWDFFDAPAQDDTFVKTMLESQGENEGALDREIHSALKDYRNQTGARR